MSKEIKIKELKDELATLQTKHSQDINDITTKLMAQVTSKQDKIVKLRDKVKVIEESKEELKKRIESKDGNMIIIKQEYEMKIKRLNEKLLDKSAEIAHIQEKKQEEYQKLMDDNQHQIQQITKDKVLFFCLLTSLYKLIMFITLITNRSR